MTQPSIHHPLPSIASTLPPSRQPLDPYYPSASLPCSGPPLAGTYTPPLLQPRAPVPVSAVGPAPYTPTPSYLPPLQTTRGHPTHIEDSPPVWNRVPSSNSPNSVSTSSRSPLRTPRELPLYAYDLSQPAEPWHPKPRVWNEQPLFDDFGHTRDSVSPKMQPYPSHMMPMVGSSMGPHDYSAPPPPPPTFGGGLGAAFPDLLPPPQPMGYESIHHPSMAMGEPDPYRITPDRPHVGPAEYAQALEVYKHIQLALPHIRPMDMTAPQATGQSYRTIVDSSATALGMLSGRIPAKPSPPMMSHPRPAGLGGPEAKRLRLSHMGDKEKPATYCRGCGATETPEWRRGPLGPRTLCNACGLVHMKMMRKKKKAEEKAAAAAAAAAAATAKGI